MGTRMRKSEGRTESLYGPLGLVAGRVVWATTFRARRKGVLGREPLEADEAMVIRPCRQVHTYGVGYDLDAVFCDRGFQVIHVETLVSDAKSQRVRRAASCIELLGGRAVACGIEPGAVLEFRTPS